MKLRENLALKALAFAAAVAAITAAVMMFWYQAVNFDFLWENGSPGSCAEMRRLMFMEEDSICQLLDLQGLVNVGAELSDYRKTRLEGLENAYSAQNTNLRWQLTDRSGKTLLANTQDDARLQSSRWIFDYYGGINWGEEEHYLPVYLWVDETFPVNDQFRAAAASLEQWKATREAYLTMDIFLTVLGLVLTVFLCAGAGHKRGVEGISLHGFHRLPGDVVLLTVITGVSLIWIAAWDLLFYGYPYYSFPLSFQMTLGALLIAGAAVLVLAALVTFSARCKARTLLRNTLIWRLCGWVWRLFLLLWGVLCGLFDAAGRATRALPLVWKAVIGCMAYVLFTFWIITSRRYYYDGSVIFLWMAFSAAASLYLCIWAYQWKRIRQATREIIGGNTDCRIDTRRMLPDLRGHADELNNLGHAVSAAVEDRMKSEHFKAELITNVSHDLKTPLTSIINYVDLLKKADIADPRAREYIEVLDRKSQRLKKLTEDLVEASKASTGNLAVSWERLDFKQLADQALAECGDRLGTQGLTVVRALPEEPVWVDADGRHLWRVLDNLLTNCGKYALPGTRVYVDLRESGGWAVLSVKNISRDPLDIPAERLMERFVRGDESRNASGSGLGLSIAQSLTELQHGQFSISIDGDLFKAVVSLPLSVDRDSPPILQL